MNVACFRTRLVDLLYIVVKIYFENFFAKIWAIVSVCSLIIGIATQAKSSILKYQRFPRFPCSRSIASNNDLKFPTPNP